MTPKKAIVLKIDQIEPIIIPGAVIGPGLLAPCVCIAVNVHHSA
jgi:hypothetical protein